MTVFKHLFLLLILSSCNSDGNNDPSNESKSTDKPTDDMTLTTPLADISVARSSGISTIAIVTWPDELDVDASKIDEAYIEYGLDEDFNHKAPINTEADNLRTVLLGMKQGALNYKIRSTIKVGGDEYVSEIVDFETGYSPSDLLIPEESFRHPSLPIEEGYIMTSGFGASNYTYIIDTEGDIVWWYEAPVDGDAGTSDAAMDWNGEYVYFIPTNPSFSVNSHIRRVSIDGEELSDIPAGRAHHSLDAVPEGGVVFVEATEDLCDRFMHLDEDGHISELFSWRDVIDLPDSCHTNYVGYDASSDAFYISSRSYDTAALVSREGELLWAIGRDDYQTLESDDFEIGIEGDINALHGLYVWDSGQKLLLFNNREESTSVIYEYEFKGEFSKKEALTVETKNTFQEEGLGSKQAGSVQRLPSGNTLVTYSTDSVIVQYSSGGEIVHRLDMGTPVGYGNWRESLYGPPPQL